MNWIPFITNQYLAGAFCVQVLYLTNKLMLVGKFVLLFFSIHVALIYSYFIIIEIPCRIFSIDKHVHNLLSCYKVYDYC